MQLALTSKHQHCASGCLWASPTLFLPAPYWFEAEASPWTCVRDTVPCVLTTTDPCASCARWEGGQAVRLAGTEATQTQKS